MPTGIQSEAWRVSNSLFKKDTPEQGPQPWRKRLPNGRLPIVRRRIVVCRYEEDPTNWLAARPHLVYNCGKRIENKGLEVIEIANSPTGREAKVYLVHIISRYDELDDYTYFLQGNPYPHAHNLDESLSHEADFEWIYHSQLTEDDGLGRPHHSTHGDIPVGDLYREMFNREPPAKFKFASGAQFIASKKQIRSKPLDFWKKCLALLGTPKYEPGFGWTMERLWGYLLTETL